MTRAVATATSPVALRRRLAASRRRLATIATLVALLGVVAVHHEMPHGMDGMAAAGAVCVAVVGAAVVVAAPALVRRLRVRLLGLAPMHADGSRPLQARAVPARAGPIFLRLTVLRL